MIYRSSQKSSTNLGTPFNKNRPENPHKNNIIIIIFYHRHFRPSFAFSGYSFVEILMCMLIF